MRRRQTDSQSGLVVPGRCDSFAAGPGFFGGASSGDPYYSNVLSLLYLNDPVGSTTFVDQKTSTWGNNNATTTTAMTLFGQPVGYCDGNISRFYSPTVAAFALGTEDFTIEFWFAPVNGGAGDTYGRMFQLGADNSNGSLFWIRNGNPNPSVMVVQGYYNGYLNFFNPVNTTSQPNGIFCHYATTRQSGYWRTFENGIIVAQNSYTGAGNSLGGQNYLSIGANNGAGESCRGYFSNFRLTANVARYTTNFTPPTAPFPNY